MPKRFFPVSLTLLLLLLPCLLIAQDYERETRARQAFWTEVNLMYKTKGRWSFQLDHQYRRQAEDNNGRDWNVFRYPLLQVFRPWVSYQLSTPVRLSLSPVGLWWNWGRTSEYQPLTFFQEVRVIPQLQITKPLGDGEFIQRFRTELRWPSQTDTLATTYIFLSDGESQQVLADRFNIRLRAMARWLNPVFKRSATDKRWYTHVSLEPMVVVSRSITRFDQNRTYVAMGRRLNDHIRFELGYLNQFSIQTNAADRLRTFRFNNALHVYMYLENFRRSKSQPDSGPE
ncbi:DUF2490 domain-containing protein [Fibrisoma montanum]|uniref:DUF2490 domain-containing protein n=1 Tax=Fibrisoma montanum TaxID=2305895 RepID=A0A418MDT5_9BACT|nr:DUF2490 domain-containing protein [Fibrisoma montanum]RIV24883.1 DUF2490 domain-containing protein [Fibrisoma montanum]